MRPRGLSAWAGLFWSDLQLLYCIPCSFSLSPWLGIARRDHFYIFHRSISLCETSTLTEGIYCRREPFLGVILRVGLQPIYREFWKGAGELTLLWVIIIEFMIWRGVLQVYVSSLWSRVLYVNNRLFWLSIWISLLIKITPPMLRSSFRPINNSSLRKKPFKKRWRKNWSRLWLRSMISPWDLYRYDVY